MSTSASSEQEIIFELFKFSIILSLFPLSLFHVLMNIFFIRILHPEHQDLLAWVVSQNPFQLLTVEASYEFSSSHELLVLKL